MVDILIYIETVTKYCRHQLDHRGKTGCSDSDPANITLTGEGCRDAPMSVYERRGS